MNVQEASIDYTTVTASQHQSRDCVASFPLNDISNTACNTSAAGSLPSVIVIPPRADNEYCSKVCNEDSTLNTSTSTFERVSGDEENTGNINCSLIGIVTEDFAQSDSSSSQCEKSEESLRLQNYAYQVLTEGNTDEGDFLIKAYDYEKFPENRKKLLEKKKQTYFSTHQVANILVSHEIKRTKSYSIAPERLEFFDATLHELFPIYKKGSFYTKAQASRSAHGDLQLCYSKARERAIAIELIDQSNSRKRKHLDEEITHSEHFKDLQKPVTLIDDNYKEKWASTACKEKKEFFKKNNLATIVQTFRNYLNCYGYKLIEADFAAFFNKPTDSFEKNWPILAHKIIKFAQSKKADANIKKLLQENSLSIANGNVNVIALILLPYLFRKITKQTIRSKTGKAWNPEKDEVMKSFVYYIKETNNLSGALKSVDIYLHELHLAHNLEVGPYVVISGPTLDKIIYATVVFGEHVYQITSATAAVEICFKLMKVFCISFPHVCSHVWNLIEIEVYKFDTPAISACVNTVIQNLEKYDV